MAAQLICEIYRTGEYGGTFRSAYTITYFNKTAQIQGLSGRFTRACFLELSHHFILMGIKCAEFIRLKNGTDKLVRIEYDEFERVFKYSRR